MKVYLLLFTCAIFLTSANAFLPIKEGKEYVLEYKTETTKDDKDMSFQEVLSLEMHLRNESGSLICQFSNIKAPKTFNVPEDHMKELEEPFKILVKDGKFTGMATADKSPNGPIFRRAPMVFLFNDAKMLKKYRDEDITEGHEELILPLGRCKAKITKTIEDDDIVVKAEAKKPDCFLDPSLTINIKGTSLADVMTDETTSSEIVAFDKKEKTLKKLEQILFTQMKVRGGVGNINRSTYLYLIEIKDISDTIKVAGNLVRMDYTIFSVMLKAFLFM